MENKIEKIQVGQILHTHWGYEQTNVEFFRVTQFIGKKHFLIQKLKQDVKETSPQAMAGTTTPRNEIAGAEIKAFIDKDGNAKISEDSPKRDLYLWDGKPQNISWYG